jgi:hypothetical protein
LISIILPISHLDHPRGITMHHQPVSITDGVEISLGVATSWAAATDL